MNELIINSSPSEVVIAILKDKKLVELHRESRDIKFAVGDICVLEPGEAYYAEYVEDTEVFAIKTPSVPGDKYYI